MVWGVMLGDGMLIPDSWATKQEAEVVLREVQDAGYTDAILVSWQDVPFDSRANRRGVREVRGAK